MEADFKTRVLQPLADETLEDLAAAIQAEQDRRYRAAELAREAQRAEPVGVYQPGEVESDLERDRRR